MVNSKLPSGYTGWLHVKWWQILKLHPNHSAGYRDTILISFEHELVHDKEYACGEEFFGDYIAASFIPRAQ